MFSIPSFRPSLLATAAPSDVDDDGVVRTKMVRRDTMSLQPFRAGDPRAALMAKKKAAAQQALANKAGMLISIKSNECVMVQILLQL